MSLHARPNHFWHGFHHAAGHVVITLLAVGIAFSLPPLARYILFNWWPAVSSDSRMLLFTEIGFAATLVVLFNIASRTWHYRRRAKMSHVAALIDVHEEGGWLSRRRKRHLLRQLPWKRDVTIMAVSGAETFSGADAELRQVLPSCYEIRVMLINPDSAGARACVSTAPDPAAALLRLRDELAASIAYLRSLRAAGRQVALKLYDEPPFWKLVFTGEHAWVRCCHDGRDFDQYPEYVFALQADKPARGFFPVFYTYFLNQWSDARHPDYDFDTGELVYRSIAGQAAHRTPFPAGMQGAEFTRERGEMATSLA